MGIKKTVIGNREKAIEDKELRKEYAEILKTILSGNRESMKAYVAEKGPNMAGIRNIMVDLMVVLKKISTGQ